MSETSPTEPHQNFRAVSQGERKNYLSENVIFNSSVRANSKEICEEISFPSFFRKMLMSAFLLRFKVNYLEKVRGYPYFSLWIPIALAKVYFFRVVLTCRLDFRRSLVSGLPSPRRREFGGGARAPFPNSGW